MTSKEKLNEIIVSNDKEAVEKQLNYEKALYTRNQENKGTIDALREAGLSDTVIKEMLGLDDLNIGKFDEWNSNVIDRLDEVFTLMNTKAFENLSEQLQCSVLKTKRFIIVEKENKAEEEADKTK